MLSEIYYIALLDACMFSSFFLIYGVWLDQGEQHIYCSKNPLFFYIIKKDPSKVIYFHK